MTNTPSQQKPWMKYYSPEALCAEMPHCKAFDYILEQNKDRLDAPALHYYGADITFNDLIDRVDQAARAFTALGVKEGDIVSFLSVALPETIACVYALSRIGAAANTIDPRMDVESIKRMIMGSGSKILVVIDIAFPKVRPIMSAIKQEKIIIQSAANSLPPVKKIAMKLATKTDVTYSDTVIKWSRFIHGGKNTKVKKHPIWATGWWQLHIPAVRPAFPRAL